MQFKAIAFIAALSAVVSVNAQSGACRHDSLIGARRTKPAFLSPRNAPQDGARVKLGGALRVARSRIKHADAANRTRFGISVPKRKSDLHNDDVRLSMGAQRSENPSKYSICTSLGTYSTRKNRVRINADLECMNPRIISIDQCNSRKKDGRGNGTNQGNVIDGAESMLYWCCDLHCGYGRSRVIFNTPDILIAVALIWKLVTMKTSFINTSPSVVPLPYIPDANHTLQAGSTHPRHLFTSLRNEKNREFDAKA
ncbi:hypothetical protein C8J57DRAFT_1575518 [Mycena rebaudengoi]|nr:hypothetical protein C8J57DRAFT_1575518 [Mycena rebaudengoi]